MYLAQVTAVAAVEPGVEFARIVWWFAFAEGRGDNKYPFQAGERRRIPGVEVGHDWGEPTLLGVFAEAARQRFAIAGLAAKENMERRPSWGFGVVVLLRK